MRSPLAGIAAVVAVLGGVVGAGVALSLEAGRTVGPPPPGVPLGEFVYDESCSSCHTLEGASLQGPKVDPMMAAYRALPRDTALARIVSFVRHPDPDSTRLSDSRADTWKKMVPLRLREEEVRAAAEWMMDRASRKAARPSPEGREDGEG